MDIFGKPNKSGNNMTTAGQCTAQSIRHNTPLLVRLTFAVFILLFLTFMPSPAHSAAYDDEYEIELGRKYSQALENKYGLVKDESLLQKINTIGQQLAAVSDRPELPYTFKIIKNSQVNAICFPGGFVYLYRGLVKEMPTDAELSGALAHEISHIALRHISQNSTPKHQMELEADAMAVKLALRAGHNPYGIFTVVSKLDRQNRKRGSHPGTKQRLRLLDSIARQKNISPLVVEVSGGKSLLANGKGWQMEVTAAGGYTAMQRGWLLAGELYLLSKKGTLAKEDFSVSLSNGKADIYWQSSHIYTVYQNETTNGKTISELADTHIDSFIAFYG